MKKERKKLPQNFIYCQIAMISTAIACGAFFVAYILYVFG